MPIEEPLRGVMRKTSEAIGGLKRSVDEMPERIKLQASAFVLRRISKALAEDADAIEKQIEEMRDGHI